MTDSIDFETEESTRLEKLEAEIKEKRDEGYNALDDGRAADLAEILESLNELANQSDRGRFSSFEAAKEALRVQNFAVEVVADLAEKMGLNAAETRIYDLTEELDWLVFSNTIEGVDETGDEPRIVWSDESGFPVWTVREWLQANLDQGEDAEMIRDAVQEYVPELESKLTWPDVEPEA